MSKAPLKERFRINMKKGEMVLVHPSPAQINELKGNKTTPLPAIVVSVWENEYPNHPKCTTGINVRVFTDSDENPLWLTSLPMECPEVVELYGDKTATYELMQSPIGAGRSHCLWLQVPAEKMLYDAISEIERMGADERLSKAQMLITEAQALLSGYVDESITKK